jgi:hypothetical protein
VEWSKAPEGRFAVVGDCRRRIDHSTDQPFLSRHCAAADGT